MRIEDIIEKKLRVVFKNDSIVYDKSRFAGGLTNYNYILDIDGKEYVVRQPGYMTDQMIDRKIEKLNNSITSELGLNSKCIYFDEETGIKFSEYIANSRNIAEDSPENPKNIHEVSMLLKQIHESDRTFPNIFDFKIELKKYENLVKNLKGDFFFDYEDLKTKLIEVYEKYVEGNVNKVPCHNDTVPENFVIDEIGKAYLIDWEYAGLNDSSWDIAAYILESKLSAKSIEVLFDKYYGYYPSKEETMKLKIYMLTQDLLWTVWALVRHYGGDDFLEYCSMRYERFRKNMIFIDNLFEYEIADMVKN